MRVAMRWTEEIFDLCIKILAKHTRGDEAVKEIQSIINPAITYDSMREAFRRAKKGSPMKYTIGWRGVEIPITLEEPEQFPIPTISERAARHAFGGTPDGSHRVSITGGLPPERARSADGPGHRDRAEPKGSGPAEDTRLRVEMYGLREQVRELAQENKHLIAELHDREAQLGIVDALRRAPPPIVARKGVGEGKRRQGTPVLLLSDWHVEEPVLPEAVNGLNEYNLEIADGCITKCAEAFEWLSNDHRYDCREGIVWLGGDLFSGWIHDELAESNFLSPVQAVEWLQPRIERMLRQILASTKFERILVVCNDGNHGRLTHKMRVATRTANSLEWLLYKTLAARMANEPRLQWVIAEGEWNYVDVFTTSIGFTHGDSFRYQGGVGGLLIPLRRGYNEIKKYRKTDLMVCGHFHQRTDTGEIVVNGSMIGLGPYSMHIHAAPEPRQQSFFLIDSVRGKCVSAPVWL